MLSISALHFGHRLSLHRQASAVRRSVVAAGPIRQRFGYRSRYCAGLFVDLLGMCCTTTETPRQYRDPWPFAQHGQADWLPLAVLAEKYPITRSNVALISRRKYPNTADRERCVECRADQYRERWPVISPYKQVATGRGIAEKNRSDWSRIAVFSE